MSRVTRLRDDEAVARAAAEDFVALAGEAAESRGRFAVALSGGSTPRRLYELLALPPLRDRVDWGRVDIFWGDERAVPPADPGSNYGGAAAWLDAVGVPPGRIHRIQAERPDSEQAAADYQLEIARVFGVPPDGPPPAFDLILLGMGTDGHTASIFPYSHAVTERRRWVLSHHVTALGATRITLTLPVLNRAREVRLLVTGAEKAAALHAALEGPRDPERLPVQSVAPEAGRLIWLVDQAAAARLSAAA